MFPTGRIRICKIRFVNSGENRGKPCLEDRNYYSYFTHIILPSSILIYFQTFTMILMLSILYFRFSFHHFKIYHSSFIFIKHQFCTVNQLKTLKVVYNISTIFKNYDPVLLPILHFKQTMTTRQPTKVTYPHLPSPTYLTCPSVTTVPYPVTSILPFQPLPILGTQESRVALGMVCTLSSEFT